MRIVLSGWLITQAIRKLPVKGGKAGENVAKDIKMDRGHRIAVHQRHDQPTAGFRQATTFQAQDRKHPCIKADQVARSRVVNPLGITVMLVLL